MVNKKELDDIFQPDRPVSYFVHEMKCNQCQSIFIIPFGASLIMKYCPRCRCKASPTASMLDMNMKVRPSETTLADLFDEDTMNEMAEFINKGLILDE